MRLAGKIVAGVVGTLLVLYGVVFWAFPAALLHVRDRSEVLVDAWRGEEKGKTGLIYVESPEVYTRQRLVNDRYLQDTWLHTQLQAIDDPENAWLDAAQVEMQRALVDVLGGPQTPDTQRRGSNREEAAAPVALGTEILDQVTEVPFETRFKLQSEARDKIRQLILENALDDRHDLSGNTVFGLKFDTSILPSSNARLHPTVIVQMAPSPLERLLYPKATDGLAPDAAERMRRPEEFIGFFLGFAIEREVGLPISPGQRETLESIDEDFADWIGTIERRIRDYAQKGAGTLHAQCLDRLSDTFAGTEDPERPDPARAAILETLRPDGSDWVYVANAALCEMDENVREATIDALMFRAGEADAAIAWVTRQNDPPVIARRLPNVLKGEIGNACSIPDYLEPGIEITANETDAARQFREEQRRIETQRIDGLTLGTYLSSSRYQNKTLAIPVPGAWGRYVDAVARPLPPQGGDLCRGDLQIDLLERRVSLYLLANDPGEDPQRPSIFAGTDFLPVRCEYDDAGEEADCAGFRTWLAVENLSEDAQQDILASLTPQTLSAIAKAVNIDDAPRFCRVRTGQDTLFTEALSDDDIAFFAAIDPEFDEVSDCRNGLNVRVRLGAFEFFRRMSEVESYTYAAFPRGDVSGVVTEASRRQGVSGATGYNGFGAWVDFDRARSTREIEAVPAVINFASGQSRIGRGGTEDSRFAEQFDFGWSVVKAGDKEPMMVSQMVLVSIPAYLDKIDLTLWKGFLDLDKVPVDRDGNYDLSRQEVFQERVEDWMVSAEKRMISLNLPPDYTALDSIVIGRNEIFGPQIDQRVFQDVMPGASGCLRVSSLARDSAKGPSEEYFLDLVIPGERLWRSTVVTLGGVKAERIEVMPDMRGILAHFRFPQHPASLLEKQRKQLYVWTSEGEQSLDVQICNDL